MPYKRNENSESKKEITTTYYDFISKTIIVAPHKKCTFGFAVCVEEETEFALMSMNSFKELFSVFVLEKDRWKHVYFTWENDSDEAIKVAVCSIKRDVKAELWRDKHIDEVVIFNRALSSDEVGHVWRGLKSESGE